MRQLALFLSTVPTRAILSICCHPQSTQPSHCVWCLHNKVIWDKSVTQMLPSYFFPASAPLWKIWPYTVHIKLRQINHYCIACILATLCPKCYAFIQFPISNCIWLNQCHFLEIGNFCSVRDIVPLEGKRGSQWLCQSGSREIVPFNFSLFCCSRSRNKTNQSTLFCLSCFF